MRAEAFLADAERLPLVGLEEILGGRGVVVIAPHPDDESLGCGALIAGTAELGLPVRIVVLSDGTGSHPQSALYPPVRLKIVREGEALRAALALGLSADAVSFMGLPDRHVPASGPAAERAAEQIASVARAVDAGTLLVTWKHDPHCDHGAAHAIACMARARLQHVRLRSFPIWGWTLPPDHDVGEAPARGVRLEIGDRLHAKRAAILAHRSQTTGLIEDDLRGFRLKPDMIERFCSTPEIYLDEPT
jgi:LmbE family N-acetylglucosaminyl deacetylase